MHAMSKIMRTDGYRIESARIDAALPRNDTRTRYQSFPPSTDTGQWMTIGYHGSLSVQGVGYTERESINDAIQQMKELMEPMTAVDANPRRVGSTPSPSTSTPR
jgi:hypothetical protein